MAASFEDGGLLLNLKTVEAASAVQGLLLTAASELEELHDEITHLHQVES